MIIIMLRFPYNGLIDKEIVDGIFENVLICAWFYTIDIAWHNYNTLDFRH